VVRTDAVAEITFAQALERNSSPTSTTSQAVSRRKFKQAWESGFDFAAIESKYIGDLEVTPRDLQIACSDMQVKLFRRLS
jgi:hypothetical protein